MVRESVRPLTAAQDLEIIRRAFRRNPTGAMLRKLAPLLFLQERYDELIEVLTAQPDLDSGLEEMLAQAHFTRETTEGDELALAAAARAKAAAQDDLGRAAALATRGKAETRLGRPDAARETLTEALALDPRNKDACKRLAALLLAEGDAAGAAELTARLAAAGAAHSRLFAAQAVASARSGDLSGARSMIGTDRFFAARKLPPPPGWDSIERFNAALAKELLAHPELRYERYGTASELTWRIDRMPHRAAPLARLLVDGIAQAIDAHLDTIAGVDHPWVAARPSDAVLRSWCVITDSDGYENWHVHQFGWLSGAYYVRVPEVIAQGDGEGGCIALGLPEDLAGEEAAAAYGTQVIRPEEGLLLLFPSHTYHRTYPHGAKDRRICIAFDVKPLASAPRAEAEAA
jgi:uncharacterized protein (TIGR02466 family)